MSSRFDFYKSLISTEVETKTPSSFFLDWLRKQREAVNVKITKVPFSSLTNWHFDRVTGNICHDSGKFFTIQGIDVVTNYGSKSAWQQPIINQPEVGILGIITKKFNGVLHFLMQAKIEPGNINFVQLSPTLQATKSNYTQVHGGNKPLYLEYFTNTSGASTNVLIDQLQSEQGARFLKKRNRNIIIEVLDDIPVYDNFIWLTLSQLKHFTSYDNVINMDTRTVISSISFGSILEYDQVGSFIDDEYLDTAMILSALDISKALFSMDHIISWITNLKTFYELKVSEMPLNLVKGWHKDDFSIFHIDRKYFSVHAVDVVIGNREVVSWSQPIVESAQEGLIGFIVKKINGVFHFLVQAKVEAGNFDILELAPTVQCLTGNYRKGLNEYEVPFIEYFTDPKPSSIIHKSLQSEEGGRFYREQNLNIVVEVDDSFDQQNIPKTYTWMTLSQLMEFIRYNNYLNIQARSILSVLDFKKKI